MIGVIKKSYPHTFFKRAFFPVSSSRFWYPRDNRLSYAEITNQMATNGIIVTYKITDAGRLNAEKIDNVVLQLQMLYFLLGRHARAGGGSSVRRLVEDVVEMIFTFARAMKPGPFMRSDAQDPLDFNQTMVNMRPH